MHTCAPSLTVLLIC